MAGIYIHIPFCKQACYYCDFHFSTNQEKKGEMVNAIARELHLQQTYLDGEQIETIYFGGGTPSLLSAEDLKTVLQTIGSLMTVVPGAEVTLEANPDDLSPEKLTELFSAGINRLSIGIQSFDDRILHYLNRAHNAESSFECIEASRAAGFRNLSLDLIYAIPGQDDDAWMQNIAH
ncbi:MAG TPA: radical SAM protein, partial [Cyclobacteriaceae bacterium]